MNAGITSPLGTQSKHLSVELTERVNFGNSLMNSEGAISKLCDSNNETNPDTSGAA
jgi:hypothetical protein